MSEAVFLGCFSRVAEIYAGEVTAENPNMVPRDTPIVGHISPGLLATTPLRLVTEIILQTVCATR